jgi:hypothetical protein
MVINGTFSQLQCIKVNSVQFASLLLKIYHLTRLNPALLRYKRLTTSQ